jgi:hypothetical protein
VLGPINFMLKAEEAGYILRHAEVRFWPRTRDWLTSRAGRRRERGARIPVAAF